MSDTEKAIEAAISNVVSSRDDLGHVHFVEIRDAVFAALRSQAEGTRREAVTPEEIARAWWSVQDEWIVRLNKEHDRKQWEVVHDWGRGLVSEQTMKIISRHETQEQAKRKAGRLENAARGAAVLSAAERGGKL